MREKVEAAVTKIESRFRDRRVQHCQLTVVTVSDSHCELEGTVLDDETRTAVTIHLYHDFPELIWQTDCQIREILRVW